MGNLLAKLELIGIKTESTQNTAATIAATDFFYASGVDVAPEADYMERDWTRNTLDQLAASVGAVRIKGKMTLWLRASGTAGTAWLPVDAILQAAGFVPTVVAATSVTYNVTSAPSANFVTLGKSATIDIYKGASAVVTGLKYHVVGAVATKLVLTFEAGKPVSIEVEFSGLYTAVADAATPTATPTFYTPPIVQSATFSIQGLSATISKFTIDLGLETIERHDMNSPYSIYGYQITGRKPKITFDPEATTVATHDWWGKMVSGAEGAVSIVVGSGAGSVNTITMPKVQYQQLKHGDRNGILTLEGDGHVNMNAGDDCLVIAQT